jgi:2-haloacid dehalogenase
MPAERWATFDCYGTLVDWDVGIHGAIETVAPDHAERLLRAYHELEPEVQAERFRPYREVLAESLRRATESEGVGLPEGGAGLLAETLPGWPVFDDVVPAMDELRAGGWRRAILSNVDRDLIAGTLEHMGVEFDLVVTAEDVCSYKHAHGHFERFRELTDAPPPDWIHVAASVFHDIEPARELGVPSVWINREGRPADVGRDAAAILPDLRELRPTLARLAAGRADA